MFRNREFKLLILISTLVVVAEAILLSHGGDSIAFAATGIILCYAVYIIVFTAFRYRKIKKMSEWLSALQGRDNDKISEYIEKLKNLTGHDEYRFTEYVEGELSILQNEVYKVTV